MWHAWLPAALVSVRSNSCRGKTSSRRQPTQTQQRFGRLCHAIFCCALHIILAWRRTGRTAESFVDHHFFAVVRPTLDEGIAAEDFFHLCGRRRIQMEELHVMAR